MSNLTIPQWLIHLAIAVALPTIACVGFYSVNELDERHSAWATPVMFAWPLALIGLTGLAGTFSSLRRNPVDISVWIAVIFLSAMVLIFFWF